MGGTPPKQTEKPQTLTLVCLSNDEEVLAVGGCCLHQYFSNTGYGDHLLVVSRPVVSDSL